MNRTTALFFYTLAWLVLFPQLPIFFFVPFLCTCFYKHELKSCLWLSFICGLTIDLFSGENRLGLYTLNYCATTFILFSQRFHYFEDSLSTIPILTFYYSALSTLIQVSLFYLIGFDSQLSWKWVRTDLIILPLADALFGFIAFTLPGLLIPKEKPKRTKVLSLKDKT